MRFFFDATYWFISVCRLVQLTFTDVDDYWSWKTRKTVSPVLPTIFFFFVCTYILYLLLILWLVCVVCKYLDCYSHQTVLERYHNQKENGGKKKTAIFFFVKFYMYRYDTCNTDNFSHIFLQCKTKRKKKLRFPIFFYLSINHMPHRCCFFLHTLIFIFFYLLFFYSSYSLIRWQDKAKKSLKKGGTHQLNIEVTQS